MAAPDSTTWLPQLTGPFLLALALPSICLVGRRLFVTPNSC